jgi:hypothetical protein
MKSAVEPNEEELVARLVQRLDRLQGQLDELNNTLKRHLDRMRSRRRRGKAKLASFSHQAKKLSDHAPF